MRYCRPYNAGLSSSNKGVAKSIAAMLEAMDGVNGNNMDGKIVKDVQKYRWAILRRLEKEGWYATYGGTNKLKVYTPGSPGALRGHQADAELSKRRME